MFETTNDQAVVIRGARVIDPACARDEMGDVAIVDGCIARAAPPHARVIDASGWILCPGLMDIHVHLREPGYTHKETIETGTAAATAGGFTYVACMPNTNPTLDEPESIRFVMEQANKAGHCDVGPIAAITRARAGRQLTDFASLQRAGAVAFSDDGDGVEDDSVMRAALQRARELDAVLIQHGEYKAISAGGVMHAGEVARRLGLPGIDPRSEQTMIERDVALCREIPARYHVAHISTGRAVDLVRQAKAEGLPVTAEVCTHHLVLTEQACLQADPNTKMYPPLRTESDVQACRQGLRDGTIDCIVTDHAPHTAEEKAVGFLKAPPGIVGLETAIGLAVRAMVESDLAGWPDLITWFTTGPAAVLNVRRSPIEVGCPANLTLLDPQARWTVDPERFASKARNTPFAGWTLRARAVGTIRRGQVSLASDAAARQA